MPGIELSLWDFWLPWVGLRKLLPVLLQITLAGCPLRILLLVRSLLQ